MLLQKVAPVFAPKPVVPSIIAKAMPATAAKINTIANKPVVKVATAVAAPALIAGKLAFNAISAIRK